MKQEVRGGERERWRINESQKEISGMLLEEHPRANYSRAGTASKPDRTSLRAGTLTPLQSLSSPVMVGKNARA